jgi:hypothetical protein
LSCRAKRAKHVVVMKAGGNSPETGCFPRFNPPTRSELASSHPKVRPLARRRIAGIGAIIKLRMAEPERTTSFAKSVEGLHKEESALDRARSLRDQFTHAQEQNNEKEKPRDAEKPREGDKAGSQMVRADAPILRPTPSGPMRQMADRQAAEDKMRREHQQAGTAPEQKNQSPLERQQPIHDQFATPAKGKAPQRTEADKAAEARKLQEMFQARQQEIKQQDHDRER